MFTSSQATDPSPKPNYNTSSLQQFDPLRTLAFLITELNSKLELSCPADKTVHRILHEIRAAAKRIENTSQWPRSANVTSDTNLMQNRNRVKSCNSSAEMDKHRNQYIEKAAQTEQDHNLPLILRDFIQFVGNQESPPSPEYNRYSPSKAPEARVSTSPKQQQTQKEVENVHEEDQERRDHHHSPSPSSDGKRLKDDVGRDKDKTQLSKCRREISTLKIEVSRLQDRLEAANVREACLIQELENRCTLLQSELETLQDIVKKQTNELRIVQGLSAKLKESAAKINLLEKSKLEADRILVFTQLEKEKLAMLQRFQENQANSLQTQINKLTKAFRAQIKEINANASFSNLFTNKHSSIKDKTGRNKTDLSPSAFDDTTSLTDTKPSSEYTKEHHSSSDLKNWNKSGTKISRRYSTGGHDSAATRPIRSTQFEQNEAPLYEHKNRPSSPTYTKEKHHDDWQKKVQIHTEPSCLNREKDIFKPDNADLHSLGKRAKLNISESGTRTSVNDTFYKANLVNLGRNMQSTTAETCDCKKGCCCGDFDQNVNYSDHLRYKDRFKMSSARQNALKSDASHVFELMPVPEGKCCEHCTEPLFAIRCPAGHLPNREQPTSPHQPRFSSRPAMPYSTPSSPSKSMNEPCLCRRDKLKKDNLSHMISRRESS